LKKKKKSDEQKKVEAAVKNIEKAVFAIRFYPVAVDEEAKKKAMEDLVEIHNKGNDTIRQMVLYMVHENLSKASEFKITHTFDYFKSKSPMTEPSKLRMKVYRAMFNYNTSIEGTSDLIRLLSRLEGNDAAKLLTYHYSRAITHENECNHILRAAIIEALGKSESQYALKALLEYAKYSESERTLNRLLGALIEWENKIDKLKISKKQKESLKAELHEVMAKEPGGMHYG
jgi:hypothetical protein